MRRFWILSLLLLAGTSLYSAKAESAWPLWDSYAGHFISQDGRIIDPDRNSMTTSEGQSYALFFSLVANDQAEFRKILTWTTNDLAHGDLANNLPAWSWGKIGIDEWGILDSNSASDADLWIAYSLVEAGRLWKNLDYTRIGLSLLSHISRTEVADVPHLGPVLIPGKNGFKPSAGEWVLNPSYLPLPLLTAAAGFQPQGPWKQMVRALPDWLKQASPAGFAMNWVKCGVSGCVPASLSGDASEPPRGSYDAIRVYLWAGMTNPKTEGAAELMAVFAPMLSYVNTHLDPPESVSASGSILSASSPVSFDAALIPLSASAGDHSTAARLQQNVMADMSKSTGLLGDPPRYYDQNLALFALGWQERRFGFAPDGTLRVAWAK
jgi:endoglucanase